ISLNKNAELAGLIRRTWLGILVIWLFGVVALVFMQGWIMQRLSLTNPAGLRITMVAVLLQVWLPLFWGVLQGQQNFLWLGWSMISNGVGRVTIATVTILIIHHLAARTWYAAGMMIGVVCGLAVGVGFAMW